MSIGEPAFRHFEWDTGHIWHSNCDRDNARCWRREERLMLSLGCLCRLPIKRSNALCGLNMPECMCVLARLHTHTYTRAVELLLWIRSMPPKENSSEHNHTHWHLMVHLNLYDSSFIYLKRRMKNAHFDVVRKMEKKSINLQTHFWFCIKRFSNEIYSLCSSFLGKCSSFGSFFGTGTDDRLVDFRFLISLSISLCWSSISLTNFTGMVHSRLHPGCLVGSVASEYAGNSMPNRFNTFSMMVSTYVEMTKSAFLSYFVGCKLQITNFPPCFLFFNGSAPLGLICNVVPSVMLRSAKLEMENSFY